MVIVRLCRQRTQVLTYATSKSSDPDRLFDYAMVVGLAVDEDCNHCVVHVLFHYPEQVRVVVSNIGNVRWQISRRPGSAAAVT